MILFKPRSRCVFYPMGTMTQLICKAGTKKMTLSRNKKLSYLAGQFSVMSIPTLVVTKNGKVVNQSAGARPKGQILAMI